MPVTTMAEAARDFPAPSQSHLAAVLAAYDELIYSGYQGFLLEVADANLTEIGLDFCLALGLPLRTPDIRDAVSVLLAFPPPGGRAIDA